jgi:ABC-2 type transport system permease protein
MWTTARVLLGTPARSPALAVGLGLVWALVVENLLRGVPGLIGGLALLTDHLPGTTAGSLVGAPAPNAQTGGTPAVLAATPGPTTPAAVLAYLVAFTAVTLLLVRRRDLT